MTNPVRQPAQRFELLAGKVLESITVHAVNRTIQPAQKLKSGLCDRGGDQTAIAGLAQAFDQAALLEPVQ